MASKVLQKIETEVIAAVDQQIQLDQLQQALMQNEDFLLFIELRENVSKKWTEVRNFIEATMVPAYVAGEIDKTLKGAWGSITVTESDRFSIDEAELPKKFFKTIPNETKIRKTYQLEGKAPKGTTHSKRYGILIKTKGEK